MESLSDGESVIKKVKERKANESELAWHGPKSNTWKHWHEPVVVEPGRKPKRWQFKCKYCSVWVCFLVLLEFAWSDVLDLHVYTLPQSEPTDTFDDEVPQPPISNLTTNTNPHSEWIKSANTKCFICSWLNHYSSQPLLYTCQHQDYAGLLASREAKSQD